MARPQGGEFGGPPVGGLRFTLIDDGAIPLEGGGDDEVYAGPIRLLVEPNGTPVRLGRAAVTAAGDASRRFTKDERPADAHDVLPHPFVEGGALEESDDGGGEVDGS